MTVTICDVGPRDGLQNEQAVLAPHVRAELVDRLAAAGLPAIEAVSFVHPGKVPQMAGAEEVVAGLERRAGVVYSGLVLNEQGYERFAATGLDALHFNLAATETFGRRNQNATPEEALAVLAALEPEVPVSVSISVAFGCPFEGAVDPARVLDLVGRIAELGVQEIVLADTIGVVVPRQAKHLVAEAAQRARRIGIHLHPFAPRATGSVATEDLVYLLHGEGVETGVDLDALIGVSGWLKGVLGRELPGQVYRAGSFAPVAG